ncbi:GNAT family N-acetyltransferase [Halorientalis halophila]|uniref:GNAT family N-acetyltransferase n=1 Tax=Halorientalis halophila TaxID=3108499 RepID=UPI00300BBBE4
MDVREATGDDVDRVGRIAEQSFQTSYSFSPLQIETLVETAFDPEEVRSRLDADDDHLFVAANEDGVIGFADVGFGDRALLRWLHVEPGHRGAGAGTALFDRVCEAAADRDLPLVGRILAEDEEGETFCEQFGFERAGKTELDFESETLYGYLYAEPGLGDIGSSDHEIPETVSEDGREFDVDTDEATPGTDGPFVRLFEDESDEEAWGYLCTNCESTSVGSDSLGRLECQNCGNKHLADQWDAAYF